VESYGDTDLRPGSLHLEEELRGQLRQRLARGRVDPPDVARRRLRHHLAHTVSEQGLR
jgi:hypothetical protein